MNWKKRYRKLEERVLLDAAGAVTVVDAQDDTADDAQESAREQHRQEQEDLTSLGAALGESQNNSDTGDAAVDAGPEILFVDSQVEDVDQLLANLSDDIEVYFIDPDEDGVAFIADVLANSEKIYSAVHIVSHGDSGELRLGNSTLTQDSLTGDTFDNVKSWGGSLTETGDILIYGCSVAEGEDGLAFVEQLAAITGADIAASTDDTGAAALGGDWDLEVSAGEVEAGLVIGEGAQRSWGNVLALGIQDRDDLGGGSAADDILADTIAGAGSGIDITSVTFTGDNNAIATFTDLQDASSGELMSGGVVISTGETHHLPGDSVGNVHPNFGGSTNPVGNQTSDDLDAASDVDDVDLDASSAAAGIDFDQTDVTVFEFTFTPTVQKLALGYVFSTEETYAYSVNDDYTDLFGIYIIDNNAGGGGTQELVFNNLRELHQQADPDVVLNDNTGTDIDPYVEMNFVTTYEGQVVDLGDLSGFGTGEQYTIKFALFDLIYYSCPWLEFYFKLVACSV